MGTAVQGRPTLPHKEMEKMEEIGSLIEPQTNGSISDEEVNELVAKEVFKFAKDKLRLSEASAKAFAQAFSGTTAGI